MSRKIKMGVMEVELTHKKDNGYNRVIIETPEHVAIVIRKDGSVHVMNCKSVTVYDSEQNGHTYEY